MLRISLLSGQAPPEIFGPGWLAAEPDQTWAVGQESWLFLPAPAASQTYRLALRLRPHLDHGRIKRQRLTIEVNRHRVTQVSVADRTVVCTLIRPEYFTGRPSLGLRLRHPDNALPHPQGELHHHDRQRLAMAYQDIVIEPLTGAEAQLAAAIEADVMVTHAPAVAAPALEMDVLDMIGAFESAGDDCEFGYVQRAVGLERPSLLRFAGITAYDLMLALRERFAHIATDGSFDLFDYPHVPGHDFMGRERRYELVYHTHIIPGTIDARKLRKREEVRLRRLAAKYLEDIESGDKIFVVKSRTSLAPVLVAGLAAAFHRIGPATLLWVREADAYSPAGTARWLSPGLIVAYVDRLHEPSMHELCTLSWLAACREAYGLWIAQREAARNK